MTPVGAPGQALPSTTDSLPASAPSPSPVSAPDNGLVSLMDALGSQTGVALRLIVSLPANLGQQFDART